MNTSNSQNDTTYICPECGGDKCTPVLKDKYRCLYCGATFYVYNPDNQNDEDDDDDVDKTLQEADKALQEADKTLQELEELDKAEEAKMDEIAAWLKAQNDYPALKQKHKLSVFLSVVGALVGATLAYLIMDFIFVLFDLDPEGWSGWLVAIGILYCLWKALKWSYLLVFWFITGIYDNQFINKHEHELLSFCSKQELETFRENYTGKLAAD